MKEAVDLVFYLATKNPLFICIKRSSTLRVIPKNDKPSPRIVYRFGSQDNAVKDFLEYRQLIKQIHQSL